jgi:hypothetical protein
MDDIPSKSGILNKVFYLLSHVPVRLQIVPLLLDFKPSTCMHVFYHIFPDLIGPTPLTPYLNA